MHQYKVQYRGKRHLPKLKEIDINFSHVAGNQFEDAGRREEPVHLRYKKEMVKR